MDTGRVAVKVAYACISGLRELISGVHPPFRRHFVRAQEQPYRVAAAQKGAGVDSLKRKQSAIGGYRDNRSKCAFLFLTDGSHLLRPGFGPSQATALKRV